VLDALFPNKLDAYWLLLSRREREMHFIHVAKGIRLRTAGIRSKALAK
jgi:hypothetical protein